MAPSPCDPLRLTASIALLTLALLAARLSAPATAPPPRPSPPSAPPPALWARLGAKRLSDVPTLARTLPRRAVLSALADEYLAPWSSPTGAAALRIPVSAALIDSMELPNRGSTARIRLAGDGCVLFRVLEHWEKTYRLPRLAFFLDLLVKMLARFPELRKLHCEFYLNTADGPRVTVDSMSQELAALPLFGFRSERHYIDIPVPDPVEHGSKVTGAGYVLSPSARVPWESKKRRAVFRGVASCIQKQHFGNWHLNPRVRVSTISARFPELLDAGVTKWIKLSHNTTVEEIERSANISAVGPLTLEEQAGYRYILDVDGGLGSSRKRWMLMSGSTAVFQRSAVFQWYEPLLAGWVHYVPVDRWFRDLVEVVWWARQNDAAAREIARNGERFARRFLSEEAVVEFLAVLLQKYAELQPDARHGGEAVRDACEEEPAVKHGPMGCRTGWFRHVLGRKVPFGCRHRPEVEGRFVCHRPNPVTGRKEVKHGIYTEYPGAEGTTARKGRPMFADRIV